MNTHSRNGFKWSVNEILSLQREFELLGWSIDEIAQKHNRTPNSIMHKLDQEGFAEYNELYSNYNDLDAPDESSDNDIWLDEADDTEIDDDDDEYVENAHCDDDDKVSNLSQRLDNLEESISEIRDTLKLIMTNFSKHSTIKKLF